MLEWIPKSIIRMEEFLSPELNELRDYIVGLGKEDFYEVSLNLHVYEERVMFDKITWSTIAIFQEQILNRDTLKNFESYEEDPRKLKERFLKGWLEDTLWDLKTKKQYEFMPESFCSVKFSENMNHFFHDEYDDFSRYSAKKYRDNRQIAHKKRNKRNSFIDKKLSVSNGKIWHVYVPDRLALFYYGTDNPIRLTSKCHYETTELMAINCPKKNETIHAVIANYISWQGVMRTYNGKIQMDNCLAKIDKLHNEAHQCDKSISENVRNILKKIASVTRFCELTPSERQEICEAKDISPKIRLAFRIAQLNYIRLKKAEAYSQITQKRVTPYTNTIYSFLLDKIKRTSLRSKAFIQESIEINNNLSFSLRYSKSVSNHIYSNKPIYLLASKFNDQLIRNGEMVFNKCDDQIILYIEVKAFPNVIAIHLELFKDKNNTILTLDQFTYESGKRYGGNKFKEALKVDFLPDRIKFLFTVV